MKIFSACLAVLVGFVSASAATAGTDTATGTATMSVINQCTITGANVSLGTFRTTDTLQTLGDQIGYQDGRSDQFVAGTDGVGTVLLGSVTCDNGTPYTITMDSTGADGGLEIQLPNGIIYLYPMVKKIGDQVLPDGAPNLNGFGIWPTSANLAVYSYTTPVGTVANGAPQVILGNVVPWVPPAPVDGYMGRDQQLGTAGVYSGSWTTTLHFLIAGYPNSWRLGVSCLPCTPRRRRVGVVLHLCRER